MLFVNKCDIRNFALYDNARDRKNATICMKNLNHSKRVPTESK